MPTKTCCALAAATCLFVAVADARAALRIATYNVNADTDRNGDGDIDATDATLRADQVADSVLAIGAYKLAGRSAAVDVLAVQELYVDPTVTLSAIVNRMNATAGAGTYAFDASVGVNGSTAIGNGPSGLIYNTKTVRIVAATAVTPTSSTGAARVPIRYQLQATAEAGNNTFYLYNSHAKAGSAGVESNGSTNGMRRTYEYDAIRANADALGASAHVIFAGDTNFTGAQNEQAYRDLTAAAGTTLTTTGNPANPNGTQLVAGAGRAFDPLGSSFAGNTSANVKYYTESAASIDIRFDVQLLTANTLTTSTATGLRLVPQTYTAFGNSYYNAQGQLASVNPLSGSIVNSANSAALGLTLAQLQTLFDATDHLPVVADYVVVVPEPATLAAFGVLLVIARRHRARRI